MAQQGRQQGGVMGFLRDLGGVYWTLLKVMVPALIIVRLLDELGAT